MSNPFPLEKDKLIEAYRTMKTIREFEERLHVDFGRGDIPGFVHLYAGEEASGVGIMMHLQDHDRIASTHRGHGHCIAKGVSGHTRSNCGGYRARGKVARCTSLICQRA